MLDLGVAEFLSTRRRKNKSRSPPEKKSSKSEIHFTNEVTPYFSKSDFYFNFPVQFCYFFCSILLVLVRSAQTAHVVYTLCAELVFWS